jgi:hypothetical protein
MKVYNFYKHCPKNRQIFAGAEADAGVEKMAG